MSNDCNHADIPVRQEPFIDPELRYVNEQGAQVSYTAFNGGYIFSSYSRQEREVKYEESQQIPTLTLYFSLEGSSAMRSDKGARPYILRDNQHSVHFTPSFNGYYIVNSPEVRNFGVGLHESFYSRMIASELDCLRRFWDKALAGHPADLSPYPLPVTQRQKLLIYDLQQCRYSGYMKYLYFESRIIELFLMQADQVDKHLRQKTIPIRHYDLDKLHAARDFVRSHMLEPISLQQVARAAGINDFKLKKGFKELFGNTVFGYLVELKMDHARSLLLDTGATVAQVANELGYSEPQNFTKAFVRHHGYPPSHLKAG